MTDRQNAPIKRTGSPVGSIGVDFAGSQTYSHLGWGSDGERPSPMSGQKSQIFETVRRTSWVLTISIFYGLDQPADGSIAWLIRTHHGVGHALSWKFQRRQMENGRMGPNAAL